MLSQRRSLALLAFLTFSINTHPQATIWPSDATGTPLAVTITEPNPTVPTPKLIIYLENLTTKKIGQEPTPAIVADFAAQGFRVVELDYAKNPKATSPYLNTDVLAIRTQIGSGAFPGSVGLNAARN